jgi:hypothetical protein
MTGWLPAFLSTGKSKATNLLERTHPDTTEENYERLAEKLKWIKISWGVMGLYIMSVNKPTKRQFTKLWDYCQLHKVDYESLTIVRQHRD